MRQRKIREVAKSTIAVTNISPQRKKNRTYHSNYSTVVEVLCQCQKIEHPRPILVSRGNKISMAEF